MAKKAFKEKKFGEEMEKIQSIKDMANKAEGKTDNPSEFWEKLGENIEQTVAKQTTPEAEPEPKTEADNAFDQ